MLANTVQQDAGEAARLADVNPNRALPLAQRAARRAHREGDPAAAAVAERAVGHSLLYCGDVAGAIQHLRAAISSGQRAGSPALAGEAQMKLANALMASGRPRRALDEVDAALLQLDGTIAARARAQRGAILHELGRLDEALSGFHSAIVALRRERDTLGVQRALVNRALVHLERHELDAAEADLVEAEQLATVLGRDLAVALIVENLAIVQRYRGDVPAALAQLDRAERLIAANGGQLGTVHRDRAELLLTVGLTSEARAAAEAALAAHRRERRLIKIPELQLLLAKVAFLDQDWSTAVGCARRAASGFRRQERPDWTGLARLEQLRAQLAAGIVPRVALDDVVALAERLAGVGWPDAALEVRLAAATLAAARGRPAVAGEQLRRAGRAAVGRGTALVRARGWYARALLQHHHGDRRGAVTAARTGLRILDEHGAALDAGDLRAHSAAHRMDLVRLGLRIAVEAGRAAGVFDWAERGRARQLLHRPVRPPEDAELAGLLTQLRAVAAQQAESPSPRLNQHQARLERQVRDHRRLRRGDAWAPPPGPVGVARLGAALGDRALVEFVELDGWPPALTVTGGRLRMPRLGPPRQGGSTTKRPPFTPHRPARAHASAATQAAAAQLLSSTAERLDNVLLRPLTELGDRPLVVVPTGVLHAVPWSALPSCAGRPVAVSPSATLWHESVRRQPATGAVVAAAGPRLRGATAEARRVAAIHGGTALLGEAATVDAVLSALAGAGLAHLAAHGRLAADNPLFSDLLLADGPLVVYDLERLASAPHTVVLAACDSGRSKVCQGDELLGLGAMFVQRGSAQLIASVVPVPDAETEPLMVAFHERLATGEPAAEALAGAQQRLAGGEPARRAAAAGFVCIGSGTRCAVQGAVRAALVTPSDETSSSRHYPLG